MEPICKDFLRGGGGEEQVILPKICKLQRVSGDEKDSTMNKRLAHNIGEKLDRMRWGVITGVEGKI